MEIAKLPQPVINADAVGFDKGNAYACAVAAWLAYDEGKSLVKRCRDFGIELVAILNKQPNIALILRFDDSLVLAFRGTYEKANWRTNLDALPVASSWGAVHRGFSKATECFWPELGDITAQVIAMGKPIWLTGHSLGGSLATLATVKLLDQQGLSAYGLYTYGQPPTGYFRFNRRLRSALQGQYFRIVNHRDVVVEMGALGGFSQHAGQLHFIDRSGNLRSKKNLLDDLVSAGIEAGGLLANIVKLFQGNSKPYWQEVTRPISSHSMAGYVQLLSKTI